MAINLIRIRIRIRIWTWIPSSCRQVHVPDVPRRGHPGQEEGGDGSETRGGPRHPAGPGHDPLLRHDVLCSGHHHPALLRRQVYEKKALVTRDTSALIPAIMQTT